MIHAKYVSFASNVEIHEVPNTDSLYKDSLVWYQQIRKHNPTVMTRGKTVENIRGLEGETTFWERKQQIDDITDAVLDEQINQWAAGQYDPERLASLSRKFSAANQARALQAALKDHVAAYNVVAMRSTAACRPYFFQTKRETVPLGTM
jgi:hypothetical protein